MIRRPPRSTLDRSSAASDVYKRQSLYSLLDNIGELQEDHNPDLEVEGIIINQFNAQAVSYTHLRAHETVLDLVCRLLLENKKLTKYTIQSNRTYSNTEHTI